MTNKIQDESSRFKGVMTARITPFTDGIVDYDALATLADWHIQFGISAPWSRAGLQVKPPLSQGMSD